MTMTITDEQLGERESEIEDLISQICSRDGSRPSGSQERIERILRRARLESRIRENAQSMAEQVDSESPEKADHEASDPDAEDLPRA